MKLYLTTLISISLIVSGCIPDVGLLFNNSENNSTQSTMTSILQYAEVVFTVTIPQDTPAGQVIYLDILDEVTGLGLNPLRYPMGSIDSTHYSVHIPAVLGSVIKYRFSREGNPPAVEFSADGKQVRYRMYYVDGPSEVQDIVCSWNDLPYKGKVGRLQGTITDSLSKLPIPNIQVTAAGQSAITSADGSYLLDGLPTGTHNVLAYSLDGGYKTFQQGAVIATESATPASIQLSPAQYVNVTFVVKTPEGTIDNVPLRMIGNEYWLGNTIADLDGGVNAIAMRAPLLTYVGDGYYTFTQQLPVGLNLRYKYTLGDGFWNAEHTLDGTFMIRDIVVPDHDYVVEDKIETWNSVNSVPITFSVKVPENTPPTDTISIQFNPFAWMEPLPMWPLGNNEWLFVLYSPLELVGDITYRYCRNDQCGSADDIATQGSSAQGHFFMDSLEVQSFNDRVEAWAWWEKDEYEDISTSMVKERSGKFIAGVEFQENYKPSWQPSMGNAFEGLTNVGVDYVVLTPTWTYVRQNLPVLSYAPGSNPLWDDNLQMSFWAQQHELNLILFPRMIYPASEEEWWLSAERDAGWWQSWFDRYRTFILHHAELAKLVGAEGIIIGGDDILPALPEGILPDGNSSNVPPDAIQNWEQLIQEIRDRYSGWIAWATPYNGNEVTLPSFISDMDKIYLLWSAPLDEVNDQTKTALSEKIGSLLDEDVYDISQSLDKSILIGMDYPSIVGAVKGCVVVGERCLPFKSLDQPSAVPVDVSIDLVEQAVIYDAALLAISQREWVSGFISRGYYPPVALRDKSSSIHGKPAEDVISAWYPLFSQSSAQ